MNIVLVYNPKSGSALSKAELQEKCMLHDIIIDEFITLEGDLYKKLAPFIERKLIIAAIGGDGTLSAVAGLLAGTKATFAPIAGGTLNHFAKDLGLSQNVDDALENLPRSKKRQIDVAMLNKKVFINNASVGLYPTSLHVRSRFEDHFGKWPAAIVASIRTFLYFHTHTVTIGKKTFQTPFVFVGNNEYDISGGGLIERRHLDQGKLCVYIAKTTSRRALFKIVLFAFIGKAKQLDEFEVRKVTSFTMKTHSKRVSVSHDGEVSHFISPLMFEIKAGALCIIG